MRAADGWESARFRSIFLASSFSCSQTESTPAHTQVTQTVRPHAFLLGIKTARLVKWAVVFLARNQVFSAIVFSAVSFFLVSFFQSVGFFFFHNLVCLSAFFAHWQSWSLGWFCWQWFFWLWCLARNRVIILAGFLAVLSCKRCLEPHTKNIFLVCWFFLPAMRSNKACTRQVGVCAI